MAEAIAGFLTDVAGNCFEIAVAMTKIAAITLGHHDRTRLAAQSAEGAADSFRLVASVAFLYGLPDIWRDGGRSGDRANRQFSGKMREREAPLGGRRDEWAARPVAGALRSVPNARCPGLQDIADRGIYACNRVCVRGWRDYVSLSAFRRGKLTRIR